MRGESLAPSFVPYKIKNMAIQHAIIDTSTSKVTFSVKKLGFLRVKGTMANFQGNVSFDENDLENSNFNVSISAITVDTGNANRDEHLKSIDFFYVKEFPKIHFQSTAIKKENKQYVVLGNLTLLKKSNLVSIPFTFQDGILNGHFFLNRLDYGLGIKFPAFIVGKTVNINIQLKIN